MAEAAAKVAGAAQYKAIILGASGAVGGNVLKELLASPLCVGVTALVRRPLTVQHDKLQQHVVDMERLEEQTASHVSGHTVGICTLGCPQPSKVSKEEFVKVDVTTTHAFARACKAGGVKHMSLLSGVGADVKSSVYYLRVKGDAEEGFKNLDFERTSLVRPSLLLTETSRYGIGDSIFQATWPALGCVMPSKLRGIKVEDLGRAFRINIGTPGPKGVEGLHWADFKTLLESQPRAAKP